MKACLGGAVVATALAAAASASSASSKERFDEELLVRRTPGGVDGGDVVQATWQFTTRWQQEGEFVWDNFDLFPKLVGQIVEAFDVQELRLSFAKGSWEGQRWGAQVEPAPSGVEMWAVLSDRAVTSEYGAEHAWTRLTRALAGTTCASLESLGVNATASPTRAFTDQGEPASNLTVKYGQLSSEALCTENLAPLLKLLPCRRHAGLTQLLSPETLFRAQFHSVALHVRRTCADAALAASSSSRPWTGCAKPQAEFVLSVTQVNTRVPPGVSSLESITGRPAGAEEPLQACPVARTSKVFVQTSGDDQAAEAPIALGECEQAPRLRLVDLAEGDSSLGARIGSATALETPALVSTRRYATGSSRVRGGVVTAIFADPSAPGRLKARFLESVPPYLRVLPTSLRVKVDNAFLPASALWGPQGVRLGEARQGGPSLIELDLELDPGSVAIVSYEFRQVFLPLWVFPPDPNRGFDVPSAAITVTATGSGKDSCPLRGLGSPLLQRYAARVAGNRKQTVYAPPLTVSMPLPDFSMPYNVITLSSTVLALFFGMIVNTAVLKPVVSDELLSESDKRWRRRKEIAKNAIFACLLALAWLFENDRDSFDAGLEVAMQALDEARTGLNGLL